MKNLSLILLLSSLFYYGRNFSNCSSTTENLKERPEIIIGKCSDAKDSDMVYHELVERDAIPLISRNATTLWYGDSKLFCIKIMNEYNKKFTSGGGKTFIKNGGLGHFYVQIEMHSESGNAISFLIFLYGKKPH